MLSTSFGLFGENTSDGLYDSSAKTHNRTMMIKRAK